MNVNYPHDIVDDIRQVPKSERHKYVRLQENDASRLRAMTPEQRAEWLASNPSHAERVRRAEEKRARKARRKEQA